MSPENIKIRLWRDSDDIEALTALLHESYRALAEMGLRYLATHQDATVTQERIDTGECYIALLKKQLVGTLVVTYPRRVDSDCAWYQQDGISKIGQFAVRPMIQKLGIGTQLLDHAELRAKAMGAREIAIDTAEPATHLIEMYKKRGYRFIQTAQWKVTNYRSVIYSKKLI